MDLFTVFKLGADWNNCARYFQDTVHPLLVSTFPGLRIDFDPGGHSANFYFGRSRVHEGTNYDGVSVCVPPDRRGNRSEDHDGSMLFTPTFFEGDLMMEGKLQHDGLRSIDWHSMDEMFSAVKNLYGE